MILAPGEDTVLVEGSVFIVDDKWSDTESQTFLHHDQMTDATVVILEWSDLLDADVEFEDELHVYWHVYSCEFTSKKYN